MAETRARAGTKKENGSRSTKKKPVSSGVVLDGANQNRSVDVSGMIGISSKFAVLNKLITRDLNNNKGVSNAPKYTKEQIIGYLANPRQFESNLREAVNYVYGVSPHFRRLIQYFAGLSDLAYVVSPYKIDPGTVNAKTINRNYRKVLDALASMSIKTQFPKIITVCLREDAFYGTLWVTKDTITVQQLPSDQCKISSIEGNVPNVTFNFSYFDQNKELLEFYPPEFTLKYNLYLKDRKYKWIELDSPNSFAVKCNNDILDYSMPPFAGILREVYDIEEYKQLKLTKTALENYAMIVMTLGMNPDGSWAMDFDKAKEFWMNLDSVLPDEIGSILTPMKVEKIGFDKPNNSNGDTIAEAEQNLFTAAGVSSLLFNNEKASANALLLSIKADQSITFGIVKGIEDVVNRYLQSQNYGKNFKVTFLDVSPYNRKEAGDAYLKAAQYGMPTVSMYAASQGLGQSEFDSMNFLENEILNLKERLIPLRGSSTMSSSDGSKGATDEGGAPTKGVGEISESGEQNQEDA